MAWWIFQNIVMTTALAAIVLLIGRTARLGPVARHALWVLVLVKFVTPPLIAWPWAAPDPLGLAAQAPRAVERPIVSEPDLTSFATGDGAVAAFVPRESSAPAPLADRADSVSSQAGTSPWSWLLAIWAAGSLCLLGIEGTRLLRLRARIRASAGVRVDPAIVSRVAALSKRLGLRAVPVVMIAGSASPAVWGFGRPRLLWPADLPEDVSDACLDGLIVHELAHVKRGDHLVGWIELAAGVVWWWNPMFWYVRASLREQAELACDAWVISALPNGRRAYAESLLALSAAAFSGAASSSMAVVGVRASSRRVLERRLVMIMKGRAPLRLPSVGLFCLALVAAATLPAWATGTDDQQQTQTQTQSQPSQPQTAQGRTTVQVQPAQHGQQPQIHVQATPTVHVQPTIVHSQQPQLVHVQPAPKMHLETTVHAQQGQQGQQGQGQQGQGRQGQQGQQGQRQQGQGQQGQGQQGQQGAQGQQQKAKPTVATPNANWVVTYDGKNWTNTNVDAAFQNQLRFHVAGEGNLTEEGKKLVQTFEADRQAIQKEVDAKIEARRQEIIKELEKLQDQYARAGKLDEAVAIRDYLRAGGPRLNDFFKSYIAR